MLDTETITSLLKLRLLIIRAAQKDSLDWWEDDALTKLEITGQPMPYEKISDNTDGELEIRIKDFSATTPPLTLAKTLAWACLESLSDKPVFPYIQWNL